MTNRELLFNALKHGDREHQEWLKEAIDAFYEGKVIPPTRGGGNKEAKIKELEDRVLDLEALLTAQEARFKSKANDNLHPTHDFLRP